MPSVVLGMRRERLPQTGQAKKLAKGAGVVDFIIHQGKESSRFSTLLLSSRDGSDPRTGYNKVPKWRLSRKDFKEGGLNERGVRQSPRMGLVGTAREGKRIKVAGQV